MENGYNEDMDGQGCFCVEAKTVDLYGKASLFEFDGDSAFDPYDINLIFNKIYYYLLVMPQVIDKSSFSKMVHQIFIDVIKNVEQ